jgi:hypothetical protein
MGPVKAENRNRVMRFSGGSTKEKPTHPITLTLTAWEFIQKDPITHSFEKAIPKFSEITAWPLSDSLA